MLKVIDENEFKEFALKILIFRFINYLSGEL